MADSYRYSYEVTMSARDLVDDFNSREQVLEHVCYCTEYGRELVDAGRPDDALEPLAAGCALWKRVQSNYGERLPPALARDYWRALVEMAHAQARLGHPSRARTWRDHARALGVSQLEPEDDARLAALDTALAAAPARPAKPEATRVRHATFGEGTVDDPRGDRWRVRFVDGNVRVIVASMLTKI